MRNVCPKCQSDEVSIRSGETQLMGKFVKAECESCAEYNVILTFRGAMGEYRMPYGRWKNYRLMDIPVGYLGWLTNNLHFGDTKARVLLYLKEKK